MDLIYDIYRKLRSQEIRYLKQQFQSAIFEYEKVGKLFELVTQYPQKEEDFYAEKIYGKPADNTFRVTKTRLKRLMENALLNDKSLAGYPTEIINQQLQLRKKLLQADILLGRGAYHAGRNMLLQCIATAKRYELYQELFQAEFLMYRLLSVRVSADEFEEDWVKVQEINKRSSDINEALVLHYYLSNLLARKSLNKEQLQEVRTQLDRIKEIAESTQHALSLNAHYLSEIYYLQVTGDYQHAFIFCEKYLQLIQDNPIYYTKGRLGNAYIQVAQVALELGKWEDAKINAEAALAIFSPDEVNYLVTLELMFRVAFYGGNQANCEEIVATALQHPQFEVSKTIAAQWYYFSACLAFKRKDFKKANRLLNETTLLMADKFGKNIYIRIVEMMILYELNLLEPLDARIQNVRQFIKKTEENTENHRVYLLYKLLQQWMRVGYDFARLYKKAVPILNELVTFHTKFPFRTTDFELIRLDNWMADKMGWIEGEGKKE